MKIENSPLASSQVFKGSVQVFFFPLSLFSGTLGFPGSVQNKEIEDTSIPLSAETGSNGENLARKHVLELFLSLWP